jgi:hypothetical protein
MGTAVSADHAVAEAKGELSQSGFGIANGNPQALGAATA